MKNLIPLMAILLMSTSLSATPALAGGKHSSGKKCEKKCESGGDDCCKDKEAKGDSKAKSEKSESKESKPAESK